MVEGTRPRPRLPLERHTSELADYLKNWVEENDVEDYPMDGSWCPLADWWSRQKDTYPILYFLAHVILQLPASSADVARLFSKAGFTRSKYRQSLEVNRFNKMMVIQGNWHDDLYLKFPWEEEEEKRKNEEANKKRAEAAKKRRKQGLDAQAEALSLKKTKKD